MSEGTIDLAVARSDASAQQAQEALARLGQAPGAYFGVDAGIAGLHPLQATLIEQPALALRLFGDGLQAQVLSPFGATLLAQPALAAWRSGLQRGPGTDTLQALRGFLACFTPSADVLLLGALPFAAHKLARPGSSGEPLGVLFFGEKLLRRDARGQWHSLHLSLPGAAAAAMPPPLAHTPQTATEPGDDHAPGGYAAMVGRALGWLREQPLVSLTLSQSYRRRVEMAPAQAFARLRAANPAPASFFLDDGQGLQLLGASPDLQLVVSGRAVQALPVCGTVRRRPGAVGEAESLRELMNEDVDAASLAVCTDALRNDLAPLCVPGSLVLSERRRTMSLATVVHAVDRLQGRLRDGADAWDAIAATAAPVMVTGTPRAHALAAISALEASPRGWYGGLFVQVASNGDALAGTILRAAAVRGGVAEVRTGGDLMADSSPEREEQESRLKTLSLWRAFGLEAAMGAVPDGQQAAAALPQAVRLLDAQDPFGNAARDCLLGLGLVLNDAAAVTVVAGAPATAAWPPRSVVAIGDAAYQLLALHGGQVQRIAPEHGRLLLCKLQADAPWRSDNAFIAARYASFQLEGVPVGWQVWATDAHDRPVALAQPQHSLVALLFRPDSLLSEPQALAALRAALAFAAARGAA
ncbi:chorismate-binding protein [uncultured Ramlibacter sp.]|uniref:chorismate-binding protein n=1 Tax=uncultured Ramlibacter sp. TaxID=260755 RepID=UPI002623D97E|nr:chorismate-binding protein [uncultured Ramlibacter sp.]